MNVLQICKKSPLPPKDGESLAIHQITKALVTNNANVDVVCMLTQKHHEFSDASALPNTHYYPIKICTQPSIKGIINNFSKNEPYIVERFYSKDVADKIVYLLSSKTYDFIILEGVFLGLYIDIIKKNTKAKIILRAHNVEHQIWERIAENEQNVFKKTYLNRVMNEKFRIFEAQIVKKVDAIIPISPVDEQYFKNISHKPILTIPMTVDTVKKQPLPKDFKIGFIGGMDWMPNLKGIKWFLHEVWKPFVQEHKEAEFYLAGRNFPKNSSFLSLEGVKIQGEVENAASFLNQLQIVVTPIFSGSGMRVKIIEAMNLGRCVLSTSIGAEGINYTDKENIVIANTKQEWLTALNMLKNNYTKVVEIGNNASAMVQQNYKQNVYADKFIKFIKEI